MHTTVPTPSKNIRNTFSATFQEIQDDSRSTNEIIMLKNCKSSQLSSMKAHQNFEVCDATTTTATVGVQFE